MSNLIQSPVVGTTVDVPTQAQGGTQLAASGGSIINSGQVAVSLAPNPPSNAQASQIVTIQPNGSLPWPAGVACWAWTQGGAGEVYVTPIQLPFSPGVIGAPSFIQVDPILNVATPLWATNSAGNAGNAGAANVVLLAAPGSGLAYYSFGFDISSGNNGTASKLSVVIFGATTGNQYAATFIGGAAGANNGITITRRQYIPEGLLFDVGGDGAGGVEVEIYYTPGPVAT